MNFTLCGCKIKISFYFALIIPILLLVNDNNYVFFCLVGALCHELTHIFFLVYFSKKQNEKSSMEIIFTPVGLILNRCDCTILPYKQEIVISLCAGIVNLILGFILYCVGTATSFTPILNSAIYGQLAMSLNLLPIYPLDGAVALEYFLLEHLTIKKADTLVKVITCILLLPIATVSILILFRSYYNFTLLAFVVYCIVVLTMKGTT